MNNDSFNPNEYGNRGDQAQGSSNTASQEQTSQGTYSSQPYGNAGNQQNYNSQPYGQPYAPYQPAVQPAHGLGLASLICSIVGLLCCGLFTSIPAIICAVMARKQGNTETITTVGLILGIVGTVLSAISVIASMAMLPMYMEMMEDVFRDSLQEAMMFFIQK